MSSTLQETPEDEEALDLEVGDQVAPFGSAIVDQDQNQELDIGDWGTDLDLQLDPDDAEGPISDVVGELVDELPIESDEGDEAATETESYEPLVELDRPMSSAESEEYPEDEPNAETYIVTSDAELSWSPQPWCERRLPRAFPPHMGIAGTGNLILATGDSTEVLSADTLALLDSAPVSDTTLAAVTLDDTATQSLLTTTTGQLLCWNRCERSIRHVTDGLKNTDRILCMCQGTPSAHEAWILADGLVFCRTADCNSFGLVQTGDTYSWIASTDSGIIGLTRDYHLVAIQAQAGASSERIQVPKMANRSVLAKSPILAAARSAIFLGARELGAWLSTDGGRSYQEMPGCQNVTACTYGIHAGRACFWFSLFYELEDRTDLVVVDCKSRRVNRLAKFSVVTDSPGPDDDPPERARIDCLYWDNVRQRLWAAGCFGITCFEPPQHMQTPS